MLYDICCIDKFLQGDAIFLIKNPYICIVNQICFKQQNMKTRLWFKIILLLASVCFVLTSCKEEKTYRIGVSQCSRDDWRNKMNEEIERELLIHPEATVEIRSADDSNEKQSRYRIFRQ